MKQVLIPFLLITALTSCTKNASEMDASGTFEAEETIISAEAPGILKMFTIEEGQALQKGQVVGYIDSTQLYLKKLQLLAQVKAVSGRQPDIPVQLAALEQQLATTQREQKRISNLVKADAATPKQLDDINAQAELIRRQIAAQRSSLSISSANLKQETLPIEAQVAQINDQLSKCTIINPVNGTVLTKYVEESEVAVQGKPLYRIADLSTLILRAYITADQLSKFKLNQQVKVFIDDGSKDSKEYSGMITWVNDKAEFTPKTVQTKSERANMVYAIKVKVKNDGYLKSGMYGEVKF